MATLIHESFETVAPSKADALLARESSRRLASRNQMLNGIHQLRPRQPLILVQVPPRLRQNRSIRQDVESSLKLLRELRLQRPPSVLRRALQFVPCVLVHRGVVLGCDSSCAVRC